MKQTLEPTQVPLKKLELQLFQLLSQYAYNVSFT